jgi:hypothetical protein
MNPTVVGVRILLAAATNSGTNAAPSPTSTSTSSEAGKCQNCRRYSTARSLYFSIMSRSNSSWSYGTF